MHTKEKQLSEQENIISTNLNPEQLLAVQSTEGPLLVLAGAGTGKTRVLTLRIANILNNGTFPSQILAVTFTNKAAREMAERVAKETGGNASGIWLGTFHSIATRILRAHAEVVGLKPNFIIIDTSDQIRLLKQIINDYGLDEKRWSAKSLAGIIGSLKDKGLTPDKVSKNEVFDFGGHNITELYQVYQKRLVALNAADFGDLLLYNILLFQNYNDILQNYQRRFKYILVDEYQDTNICQYLWLRLLAQGTQNICCVGDDDQSIYGWRGAEVGNILKFERDFKGATVIRLERNYRSTANILNAASGLIANNKDRLGKTLWTKGNIGDPIKLVAVWDDKEEARFIADEIEALQSLQGHKLNEIAILVRAGFQTRAFEEAFVTYKIPYKVIGGLRFYERAEIKDIIAYLRLVVENGDDLSFERIINIPKRGIGDNSLKSIRDFARDNNISMFEAARALSYSDSPLKGKAALSLKNFIDFITNAKNRLESLDIINFVKMVTEESGYLAMWKAEQSIEAEGRIENIKELIRALEEFNNIQEFLEHVSLVSDIDELNQDNMVSVMTIHSAKGLEFNTVFLPGWEEGLFPHQRSIGESGSKGLEEERRLAYVGITRARHRAYILYAANRRVYNQYQSSFPSRFIGELPEDATERLNMSNGLGRSQITYDCDIEDDRGFISKSHFTNQDKKQEIKEDINKFKVGKKVFHQKFGYGKIINVNANQLDIIFEKAGIKKVIDNYVTIC